MGSSVIAKREYRYDHWFPAPVKIIPRSIVGNYTVGDNLFSWAYITPLGVNITLFNPALGVPGPDSQYWGELLPLLPTMLIIYNVSVNVSVTSNGKLLYSSSFNIGRLPANKTVTIPIILFNSSLWMLPSRMLNVSLRIKCINDVHGGILTLDRSYRLYYNYTWVNILYAPSDMVYIYDGNIGELVKTVNGPWPKRVFLEPFRYYILKCNGSKEVALWITDPTDITLHRIQKPSETTTWTPQRHEPNVWDVAKYIVALVVILFLVAFIVEKAAPFCH